MKENAVRLDGIEVLSNNMDDDLRTRAADLLARHPHLAQLVRAQTGVARVNERCG